MNRALLNPFQVRDLPKDIEDILEHQEKATCMRFNRHGNLLAVGSCSGKVTLWDFDTLSIARTFRGPFENPSAVTSVSFPAPCNGSTVLVSHQSGLVRLFDTLTSSLITQINFLTPVLSAVPHPKVTAIIIVVPKDSCPLIVHLRHGAYTAHPKHFLALTSPYTILKIPVDRTSPSVGLNYQQKRPKFPHSKFGNQAHAIPTLSDPQDAIMASLLCHPEEFEKGINVDLAARRKYPYCVTFTRGGNFILRGGPGGLVRSFGLFDPVLADVKGIKLPVAKSISAVTIQGKAAVRSIQLSRGHEKVLINSQDRAMRLFLLDQIVTPGSDNKQLIDAITTFTEIVNKSQCQSACFSRDGDFVLGGMDGADHRIHVWRTADGFLDLTLEGPREGIVEILWHPLRPVIASLGSSIGSLYVWRKNFTENWSAFAAEFSELEANEEYKEAEDEFDLKEPEDDEMRIEARERAEADDVDVLTLDKTGFFSSDSEPEDTFFYVPAEPKEDAQAAYASLADDIMEEKLEEAEQINVGVGEDDSDGNEADVECVGTVRRKRGRSGDGRESKGRAKKGRLHFGNARRRSDMNGDKKGCGSKDSSNVGRMEVIEISDKEASVEEATRASKEGTEKGRTGGEAAKEVAKEVAKQLDKTKGASEGHHDDVVLDGEDART